MRVLLLLIALLALAFAAPAGAQMQVITQTTGTVVIDNPTGTQGAVCNRAMDLDLLKVTEPLGGSAGNALTLTGGCTGTIDRVEITTGVADGIKCLNATGGQAHDLVIGGGYVRTIGHENGAHADGIQCMGGARITFNDILIDFSGATGGGGFYPSNGGAGAGGPPADIVCDGCHVIHGAASARVDASIRSGLRNSVLCNPLGAAEAAVAVFANPLTDPVGVSSWPVTIQRHNSANVGVLNAGNIAVPNTDERCFTEPGAAPDPDPDPDPDPPPYEPACAPTCDEQIEELELDLAAAITRAETAEQLSLRYLDIIGRAEAILHEAG